jgi:type II secretory pathway pseudopilin PulG
MLEMKAPLTQKQINGAAGFSLFELLIVVTIVIVVAGFALMQIVRARDVIVRENATRQLATFIEKARLDSLRRHPMNSPQMAQISLLNATSYTVTTDANYDGTLDVPRMLRLPPGSNLQFNPPFPRTIYFNWRGRTVDAAGAIAVPSFVTISSSPSNSSRIDLTTAGQPILEGLPTIVPVANSTAPGASLRPNTQIP